MAYDYKGQVIRRGNGNIRATKALQQMLADAGYSPGEVDGKFGAKTEAALRKFQVNNGLDPDMIAGEETWAQLKRSAPQPVSNPRRNLAREESVPQAGSIEYPPPPEPGEPNFGPKGDAGPAQVASPEVALTDPVVPYKRSINLGGITDPGSLLHSPFEDRPSPVSSPQPQPLPVGAGPGPESSSDEPAPSFSPDTSALPTNGGFDPSSPLSALRARRFIADALAQRNAPPGQRGPSPFDALGGKMPMGMNGAAFIQPGGDVPSPNGMPSWLMDLYK